MKIVVAIDSFKGCLNSAAAGQTFSQGFLSIFPDAQMRVVAVADGGEGTVDALTGAIGGSKVTATVTGPEGLPVTAAYGISADGTTAVIEVASACGLPFVPVARRNPMLTTTAGVGQLVLHALDHGCRRFIVGLGGSATNDGGTGMLAALGVRFYDSVGNPLPGGGETPARVHAIDLNGLDPRIKASSFIIISDVDSPLCGPRGASAVFGPQKGATPAMVAALDNGLENFADKATQALGADFSAVPGAGAAGGLGFAFRAFLGAPLQPGADTLLDAIGFDGIADGAALLITGEGHIDRQTLMGKTPAGVLAAGRRRDIPVVAVAGAVSDKALLLGAGFADVIAVSPPQMPLPQAMSPSVAAGNLAAAAAVIARNFVEGKYGPPHSKP